MKNRFSDFINGVIQNVIANAVIVIAIPVLGLVYAFSTNNPQITLLVVLVVLLAINIFINLRLLRQQGIMLQNLKEISPIRELFPIMAENEDPLASQARDELEISDKLFDEMSSPQKIVIQFTNRGNNNIQIKKVKYSANSLGLNHTAILPSYRKESGGYYLIPFSASNAEVIPGQHFLVEICLAQTWKREDIYGKAGSWGYLRLEVIYKDRLVEIFTSI